MLRLIILPCLYALFASSNALCVESTRRYVDEVTGLDAWEWNNRGIKLVQVQRLPDQTRAFFMGRGFSPENAERIAGHCVFQTVFYNTAKTGMVSLDLSAWRVIEKGKKAVPLKLTSHWQKEWEKHNVAQASRIAFQWSLFPEKQEFAPGDWNMGMLTYPVSHGASFTLEIIWRRNDDEKPPGKIETHIVRIPDLRCAEDKEAGAKQ